MVQDNTFRTEFVHVPALAKPSQKLRLAGQGRTTALNHILRYALLIPHDGGSHEGKESPSGRVYIDNIDVSSTIRLPPPPPFLQRFLTQVFRFGTL